MLLLQFVLVFHFNFILRAASVMNCSSIPKLTLKSDTGEYATYIGIETKFFYAKGQVTSFSCVANQPIKIEVESPVVSVFEDVHFAREVGNLFDKRSYCYRITFRNVFLYPFLTGKYTCSAIGKPQLSSSVFLFSEVVVESILWYYGKHILIKGVPDDEGWITIPCVLKGPIAISRATNESIHEVTNDTTSSEQRKGANTMKLVNGSLEYMPGLGFRIRANYEECCNRMYVCTLLSSFSSSSKIESSVSLYKSEALSGKVFYRVKPSDYVLGHNSEIKTNVHLRIKTNVTLSCESNFPVLLEMADMGPTADPVNFTTEFDTHPNSFYKYKAVFKLWAHTVGPRVSVVCTSMHNTMELHRWQITRVTESELSPGIHVWAGERYPLTCLSAHDKAPSIHIFLCDDPINCAMAEKFSYMHLTVKTVDFKLFPFHVIRGHSGCVRDTRDSNVAGCAEVSPHLEINIFRRDRRGIVKCREDLGNNESLVYTQDFIVGLYQGIVKLPREETAEVFSEERDRDVLKMDITIHSPLYLGEGIFVRCEALYEVYSLGFQLALQLQNRTKITSVNVASLNFTERMENQVIVFEGILKIQEAQISAIICCAPIWNSENWTYISKEVSLKVGIAPHILNSPTSETLEFGVGEVGHTLKCVFEGEPTPSAHWIKDNDRLSNTNSRVKSIITTKNATVLELESIVEVHAGRYTCEAVSVRGIDQKHFEVKVASGGGNLGLYLGIPVGLLLILATVIIYILLHIRRGSKIQTLTDDEINLFYQGYSSRAESSELPCGQQLFHQKPYDSSFELLLRNFEIERETILGEGQFGTVYKGQLKTENIVDTAAFKTCKFASDTKHLKCLMSEIKLMIHIGRHPHIIRFHGAYTRQLKFGIAYIALEFCAKGSLDKILRNLKPRNDAADYENVGNSEHPKNAIELHCTWSFQIANGMQYLASKKIVHADLATRNILVAGDNSIRITDFGLSKHLENYANYSKMGTDDLLPWRWMALESLENLKFSTQSDVWSFGVTIWEIYSMGKIPYHNRSWTKNFSDELKNGERLPHPEHASLEIYEKLLQCWKLEEDQRPTFRDLSLYFRQISYEKDNITYMAQETTC